jgi:hypothetical protein
VAVLSIGCSCCCEGCARGFNRPRARYMHVMGILPDAANQITTALINKQLQIS